MMSAALAVIAALAFVFGLGAFAVWALKRWGGGVLSPRSRITIEVVQRISVGPKTGLAVVRVGERVMAVSIGEGGMRPLFEVDEQDRQRILATSPVAVAMTPSVEARTALEALAARRPSARAETPSFAFANPQSDAARQHVAEHAFGSVLSMSLRNTTRLAVLAAAMVLTGVSASQVSAQAAPPVQTPPVQTPPVPPVVSATGVPPIPAPTAPPAITAPGVRPATPAAAATAPTQPPRQRGNGATAGRQGAAPQRPMTDMQLDTARVRAAAITNGNPRAAAASPAPIAADDAMLRALPQMDLTFGDAKDGGLRLNGTVGIVVMMGLMTLLPTLLLMMTGFTRILIVLHFLKQAMGTQGAPPAHLLAALALLLTGFVMAPTLTEMNRDAITPWLDGKITQVEMLRTGVQPMRAFMLRQTRQSDIKTFVELSHLPRPDTVDDVPLHVLMSAFVASELRTAFQIGFAIYLPFIIIDTVVASVLMSMGMFMLPPAMISLPFKLLLFVLVDGWSLTIQSLVQSFK